MKQIKNLPSSNDDRYVADVIRTQLVYRAIVRALWRQAVRDVTAITVTGAVVS